MFPDHHQGTQMQGGARQAHLKQLEKKLQSTNKMYLGDQWWKIQGYTMKLDGVGPVDNIPSPD